LAAICQDTGPHERRRPNFRHLSGQEGGRGLTESGRHFVAQYNVNLVKRSCHSGIMFEVLKKRTFDIRDDIHFS
jgi:hypothetical protein